MVTLATMDFDEKFKMDHRVGLLFWKMIDAGVKLFACSSGRHHQTMHFDPIFFVADGQGSLWVSIRLHFGNSLDELFGREQTCLFHFEQGLLRLLLLFSSERIPLLRDQFAALVRRLISEKDLTETVKKFPKVHYNVVDRFLFLLVFLQHC